MKKVIDLEEKLKEIYPNHIFVDKHSLVSLQFTSYDMIEFAKQMSEQTVDLCAENYLECSNESEYNAILNTKTQVK